MNAPRAKITTDQAGRFYGVTILCPGCLWADGTPSRHTLETDWMPPDAERCHGARNDRWGFNGDLARPTFTPSLLRRSQQGKDRKEHVCHSFITDGRIQFLGDCTHALAGQTLDLPEFEVSP